MSIRLDGSCNLRRQGQRDAQMAAQEEAEWQACLTSATARTAGLAAQGTKAPVTSGPPWVNLP